MAEIDATVEMYRTVSLRELVKVLTDGSLNDDEMTAFVIALMLEHDTTPVYEAVEKWLKEV